MIGLYHGCFSVLWCSHLSNNYGIQPVKVLLQDSPKLQAQTTVTFEKLAGLTNMKIEKQH